MDSQKPAIPVLVGDIGGTNARLSIQRISSDIKVKAIEVKTEILVSNEYKDIVSLLKTFLKQFEGTENYPEVGVCGIAGPISNNAIQVIANLSWPTISGEDVAKELNLKKFFFLNDFVTNGYGILTLEEGEHLEKLNNAAVDPNAPKAMIGAGTGMGHGYLTKNSGSKYYEVYGAEAGHSDFAPQTQEIWDYYLYVQKTYNVSHVSIERACAGPALKIMFKFFYERMKITSPLVTKEEDLQQLHNKDIIEHAKNETCKICVKVIDFFIEIYGAAAGNLCLFTLPLGGLYLLGGLSIALESHILKKKIFHNAFVDKGRLKDFMEKFPIFVVKHPLCGILGAIEYARRAIETL